MYRFCFVFFYSIFFLSKKAYTSYYYPSRGSAGEEVEEDDDENKKILFASVESSLKPLNGTEDKRFARCALERGSKIQF